MNVQGFFDKKFSKKVQAQVSLEYLLILAAFFSALAIALPAINYSVDQFVQANDTMLAKNISQKLEEQFSLFEFLADGSKKTFEFVPTKDISISMQNNQLTVFTKQKSFIIQTNSKQNFSHEFDSKFEIILTKTKGKTEIYFN
ncbi:MAG: hypothetical protein HON47_04290 [Candidatus Diapherotrites archaeon]|jgi:hypothetical protein|uniref:Class III signal peptide-containing protein n=1 Tax=Candidatus Iainarchaeum sp. TaxID=3101447 RepID=A0A8T5GGC3_9ARCH|nr:hypothetical protein [Candidatus Diapherotrites archaeon]MBT7241007.1 hypothetical protein [Candidatus Diapherotrites archaeon]